MLLATRSLDGFQAGLRGVSADLSRNAGLLTKAKNHWVERVRALFLVSVDAPAIEGCVILSSETSHRSFGGVNVLEIKRKQANKDQHFVGLSHILSVASSARSQPGSALRALVLSEAAWMSGRHFEKTPSL